MIEGKALNQEPGQFRGVQLPERVQLQVSGIAPDEWRRGGFRCEFLRIQ